MWRAEKQHLDRVLYATRQTTCRTVEVVPIQEQYKVNVLFSVFYPHRSFKFYFRVFETSALLDNLPVFRSIRTYSIMKSLVLVGALAALARALPQDIAFDVVDEAAAPPQVTVPVHVTAQTIVYNDDAAASSAAALITADPLPQATVPAVATTLSKRAVEKRDACASQPAGAGPVPSPDTASAFLAYASFAATASSAPTPSGYDNTFTNLQASNNAYGYLGLTTLQSYDTISCASKCNAIQGCSAFNIYFERDPSVDPASNCPDPASTTNIKCVFWGGPVTAANAKNAGQYRTQFQVVIAGSNGYVSKSIGPQDGYNGPNVLGNAAINAPLDCGGFNTFMGSKIFTSGPFDAGLCSAACTAQSNYNLQHPPKTGKPQTCQFYNTYMLYKNNIAQGQYCAMVSRACPLLLLLC